MIDFFEDIGDIIFGNKRLEAYQHFAKTKQFRYKRKHNPELLSDDVKTMDLYLQGKKKRKSIKGLVYKRDNKLNILSKIFDFIHYTNSGKKTTTVFSFDCEDMDIPYFIISPRGSFSRLSNLFTSNEWSDVNQDFANQFTVETDDINELQMILTFQFAEVMLDLGDFTVEGHGNFIVLYNRNHTTDIIDMDNVHHDGIELLDIILHDHSREMV